MPGPPPPSASLFLLLAEPLSEQLLLISLGLDVPLFQFPLGELPLLDLVSHGATRPFAGPAAARIIALSLVALAVGLSFARPVPGVALAMLDLDLAPHVPGLA
jgi:hypothetical protein